MRYSKLIPILIFLLIATQSSFSAIKMQPYLQAVTDSSAVVMVLSDSKTDVQVNFGKGGRTVRSAKTLFHIKNDCNRSRFVHRILLNGLESGTKYSYMAVQGNDSSDVFSFSTLLPAGTPFRFAVQGDNRSNPKGFGKVTELMKKSDPLLALFLGDLCYKPDYKYWIEEFFIPENLDFISYVPFYNAVGNHERWRQNTKAFQQAPGPDKNQKPWYSFDCGDAHFLIISTEHSVSSGRAQYKFAKRDLEQTDRKWKIVAFHIPAYGSGGHGESSTMKKFTSDLLEPNGVDFVLVGHSHFYQHNLVNGIRHLVIAGGGAPLYTPKKASYTITQAKKYHYAVFDVTPESIMVNVYDLKGNTIDSFEVRK